MNKPGITSITLVDTANSDRADAAQGASLTEISGSLTNGASLTFGVRDNIDGLNTQLGGDEDLSAAQVIEFVDAEGSAVIDITSNYSNDLAGIKQLFRSGLAGC